MRMPSKNYDDSTAICTLLFLYLVCQTCYPQRSLNSLTHYYINLLPFDVCLSMSKYNSPTCVGLTGALQLGLEFACCHPHGSSMEEIVKLVRKIAQALT